MSQPIFTARCIAASVLSVMREPMIKNEPRASLRSITSSICIVVRLGPSSNDSATNFE